MSDHQPGEVPPRRLLAHAPSERYAASGPPAADARAAGGPGTAILLGLVAAGIGGAVHVAIAVLLLATGGLLVVAATLGFVVGTAVRYGAGAPAEDRARGGLGASVGAGASVLAGSRLGARSRRGLGIGLALAAVGAALAVNWALSGAYLGPVDYLDQVYGLLVPLQAVAAAAGALAGTR